MRILLTNDDGYYAPGLKVLEEIAATLSDDVWIVAPADEQSGAGHSLTLTRPLRVRQHGARRFAVAGTTTDAVMMAHVVYPQVAPEPAGYSKRWIEDILRRELGFRGVVFSDDIGMAAAHGVGGVKARIDAHLDAGCDVVLVCHPELVEESLAAVAGRRLNTMALLGLIGQGPLGWDNLLADVRYGQAQQRLGAGTLA